MKMLTKKNDYFYKPANIMRHSSNTSKFNNGKHQQFCSYIYIFGNSLITSVKIVLRLLIKISIELILKKILWGSYIFIY